VYELLAELAAQCPNRLTVILERDGDYPSMEHLLAQLDRARSALRRGRAASNAWSIPTSSRLPLAHSQGDALAAGGFNG
jgi:hypothetical protein